MRMNVVCVFSFFTKPTVKTQRFKCLWQVIYVLRLTRKIGMSATGENLRQPCRIALGNIVFVLICRSALAFSSGRDLIVTRQRVMIQE